MRKTLLFVLAVIGNIAFAQTTPNLGLELPNYNSPGWGVSLNYNFSRLDGYLSGNYTLPPFWAQSITLTNLLSAPCLSTSATGQVIAGCTPTGTVSGQANGVIPLATGASIIGAQSHLSDNGSLITSSIPVSVTGAVTASGGFNGVATGNLPLTGGTLTGPLINTSSYTQTGTSANTFTGPTTISVANINTIVNVQSSPYNAVCNGTTDDTAAIQAAITAVNAAGGGIVTGPAQKTCAVAGTTPLNLLSGVVLSGFNIATPVGVQAVTPLIWTNAGSSTCPSPLIANVGIENMTINGHATAIDGVHGPSAVNLFCVTGAHVDRNLIQNIGWEGINFLYSANSEASNNTLLSIWGDCGQAQGTGGDGITFSNNICDGQGHSVDGGFSANINSVNTKIVNNVIKGLAGSAFGIEVAGGNNALISHNIVETGYGATGNGIRVYNNLSTDAWNVTISSNIIGAPPSGGFCIDILQPNVAHQSNFINVFGNQCNGISTSTGGGLYLNGYNINAEQNTLSVPNASGSCIVVDGNSTNPNAYISITQNTLQGCGTGIAGPTNAFSSNIYLGPQITNGVTNLTTAIMASLGNASQVSGTQQVVQGTQATVAASTIIQPNLATGNPLGFEIGTQISSNFNTAFWTFNNTGGTGSNTNKECSGVYGGGEICVDGVGNISNSTAIVIPSTAAGNTGFPGNVVGSASPIGTGNATWYHFISSGTPIIACGTGAGTSPSVCTVTGNDEAGQIAVTTGTAPANAAVIATITLHNACPTSVYAVVRGSNAAAASLSGTTHEYPDGFTASSWTLTSNSTGLAATTAYTWAYIAKCN